MTRLTRVLAAPLAASVEGPSPAAAVDLTATYVGTVSGSAYGSGFEARIAATLIQTEDQIIGTWAMFQYVFRQGTWTMAAGPSGAFTGSVIGPSAFIFEAQQTHACPGVLRGSAAIITLTARAIGLTIPQSVLLRADEVIQ